MTYMMDQAIKMEYKVLIDNKSKFVMVHSSSGFKHSLKGNTPKATVILMLTLQFHWQNSDFLKFKCVLNFIIFFVDRDFTRPCCDFQIIRH